MVISNFTKLLSIRNDRPKLLPKNNKEKVAYLISRIFGPIPLLCFIWLLTSIKSGIGFWKAIWVYPLVLLVSLIIPIAITSILMSKKQTGIEWANVEDRKKYLLPVIIPSLFALNLLLFLFTNQTIFRLSLLLSAVILSMGTIWVVFNFKISGHIVVATLAISTVVLFFGFQFFWLFILLIPIMWARLTLKVHTIPELLGGVILPTTIMLTALLLFGWPQVP